MLTAIQENYWGTAWLVGLCGGVLAIVGWVIEDMTGDREYGARFTLVGLIVLSLCWGWPVLGVLAVCALLYGLFLLWRRTWVMSGAAKWWQKRHTGL